MKKLILAMCLLSLVRMLSLFESILGEPVKFGNSIYMITGGGNEGLIATEVIQLD